MIEIDVRIPSKIENMVEIVDWIQRKSSNRAGYSGSVAISKNLSTLDPGKHPLAKMFISGNRWKKVKKQSITPFSSLAPFARHITDGNTIRFGFGYFSGTPKGKQKMTFDKRLQKLAAEITKTVRIDVTQRMRRKFAATRGLYGDEVGKTYFPIRRDTRQLVRPARKMNINSVINESSAVFAREFGKRMKSIYG